MLSLKRNGASFLWNGCADFAEYAIKSVILSKQSLKSSGWQAKNTFDLLYGDVLLLVLYFNSIILCYLTTKGN